MQPQLNRGLIGSFLGLLLLGCAFPYQSIPRPLDRPSPQTIAQEPSPTPKPQKLPIGAKIKIPNQGTILLEVARTQEQQATGLMYRTDLADNRGMLFEFNPPRPVSFWMKNTLIPLDMIFLSKGQIKYIAVDVPPCAGDPCPTYGPPDRSEIDRTIELRGRRSEELGLKIGDRLKIEYIQPKSRKNR